MANLPLIDVETRDGIATVRLNRPDKRNAMSFDLLRDLLATAKRLQRDRSLRAVLLAGAGESFSAGIALGELNNPRNRAFAFRELLKPGQSLFQKAFLAWQELPVPVIAVLHGHCFGAGDCYANCDGSTSNPLLTANDFQCFLNAYASGCS